jgi:carbon starvation protein
MGKARFMWVTALPMAWLVISTFTAAWLRVFHSDPRIGFLALAQTTQATIAAGQVPADQIAVQQQVVFNNFFDAGIGVVLVIVVGLIVLESLRQWYLLLTNRRRPDLHESPTVRSRLVPTVAGAAE